MNLQERQKKNKVRAKRYLKFWAYAIVILFALAAVGSILPKKEKLAEQPTTDTIQQLPTKNVTKLTDETAYEYAKTVIRQELKNPKSLSFPEITDERVVIAVVDPDKKYVVTGCYDKPIRKRWQVKIQLTKDNNVEYSDLRIFD